MPLPALVAGLLPALPSIIGAAGNIFGQSRAARQSNKNVQDQIRANRELAEYGYSKDLEMWERSNTYNSPTMQMQRLKQAGLNPNLVYGSGATATSSATLPKYQTVKADYSQRRDPLASLGMLSTFQDLQLRQAQIDNVRKQSEGKEIENGIANLNKMMKTAETTHKLGVQLRQDNKGGWNKQSWLSYYLDTQLDSMLEQNRLRDESIKMNQKRQKLLQFDINAWNKLESIGGKELQFGLPFLRLLMGLGR